jgi:hypothetical protein
MKNSLSLFVIAAIAVACASTAFAQDTGRTIVEKHGDTTTETEFKAAGKTNLDIQMLKDFSSVKEDDPAVAPQLAKNPALVENQAFVQKHPSLQAFLDKYPDARAELKANPGNFMPLEPGAKSASHEASGIPRDE